MAAVGVLVNSVLVIAKASAGVFGHSYALIADAVESLTDMLGSIIVLMGLRIASAPPDREFPYGKGRAETVAVLLVSAILLGAAGGVAYHAVGQIMHPHPAPAPWTLAVLVVVILIKEVLFRFAFKVGDDVGSSAVKADAWHHRSDAITSAAVFIGICVALIGGPGYEAADDWAALLASGIIAVNGLSLLWPALGDILDKAPDARLVEEIRAVASAIPGVVGTHHCAVRKLGFDHYVDLDVVVDDDMTVQDSHTLAHRVQDAIRSQIPVISKVMVHIEPRSLHPAPSRGER